MWLFAVDVHSGTSQTELVLPPMLVAVPRWLCVHQMRCIVVTMVLATICGSLIKELQILDMLDYCLLNMEMVNKNFSSKTIYKIWLKGISTPTLSKNGTALPNARNVSLTVFPDVQIEDTLWTLMSMQYGQFVSHDLSLLIDRE